MIEFKIEVKLFYIKKHLMNSYYITLFTPKCVHRFSDHLSGMLVFLLLPFFQAAGNLSINVVWTAKLRLQSERGNNSDDLLDCRVFCYCELYILFDHVHFIQTILESLKRFLLLSICCLNRVETKNIVIRSGTQGLDTQFFPFFVVQKLQSI